MACANVEEEAPPAETAPTEGVFGVAPPASRGTPSVVTLNPVSSPSGPERANGDGLNTQATGPEVMDQFGLEFAPRELSVRVGESVRFTNSEGALAHNVRLRASAGGDELFNEDTSAGTFVEYEFAEEGGYEVSCETHPGMTAFIYATTSPYVVFSTPDGAFHFPSVPQGEYTLSVWHPDESLRTEQAVTVGLGSTEVRIRSSR
jgi:plastocyanin